ncbi:MAG: glycosyltransferase family 4 protein [Anaerolineae bacterium]|nr:glycosyltransferase family 4 protein [Anaerolineae bacterium]
MSKVQAKAVTRICVLPKLSGVGGPASFYARLCAELGVRGIEVVDDPLGLQCEAVLVIGGTQRLFDLWQARRRGVRIVQRLNGMNWVHRRRFTGVRHFFRSEVNNRVLAFIRRYLAHCIVYQSQFTRSWWRTVYRNVKANERVVYNGVDLKEYAPCDRQALPQDFIRLLIVEGRMGGGHEYGLNIGYQLSQFLSRHADKKVEMVVVGDVPAHERERWKSEGNVQIRWSGIIPRHDVPALYRSSHLLYTAELNAACPNSVIEALACGLPVVGFATGAIPELIGEYAGRYVPYGGNHWVLDPPDVISLAGAAYEVLCNREVFSRAARQRAEEAFDVHKMVDLYLDALMG